MRESIRFVLDGEVVTLDAFDPTRTVLQYLREDLQRIGSKEGCAEGDCGACTVVLAELDGGGDALRYRAINACIQFLPTLDGKELITVESLSSGEELHPVQEAMVECHGSQCGFCTPGFVMSLFALYKSRESVERVEIDTALSGNLCRCTGYRPIVEAAAKMHSLGAQVPPGQRTRLNTAFASEASDPVPHEADAIGRLKAIEPGDTVHLQAKGRDYFAPHTVTAMAQILEQHPDACILAGGTDIGLWVTKQYRDLATVVYLGNVAELKSVETTATHLEIGAAVNFTDALPALDHHYPEFEELWLRFASPPIRNAATLCGNIANGSPIGDSMPALMALDASVVLRKGTRTRELGLDAFYFDYMVNALEPGEFVERVRIPLPRPGQFVRCYKLSKRFDQDISALCGAYALELENNVVKSVRVAYGGLAATVKRATRCEQALTGKPWTEATVRAGMAELDHDFTPLTDMRASREYRSTTARNLLHRFFLDSQNNGTLTNVYAYGR
ncbi:MAG: xanthine dehydrogenase small subunit [Pseudomonadota bacterium]